MSFFLFNIFAGQVLRVLGVAENANVLVLLLVESRDLGSEFEL